MRCCHRVGDRVKDGEISSFLIFFNRSADVIAKCSTYKQKYVDKLVVDVSVPRADSKLYVGIITKQDAIVIQVWRKLDATQPRQCGGPSIRAVASRNIN